MSDFLLIQGIQLTIFRPSDGPSFRVFTLVSSCHLCGRFKGAGSSLYVKLRQLSMLYQPNTVVRVYALTILICS